MQVRGMGRTSEDLNSFSFKSQVVELGLVGGNFDRVPSVCRLASELIFALYTASFAFDDFDDRLGD